MTDYTELVKVLRDEAASVELLEREFGQTGETSASAILTSAAEAIEELRKQHEQQRQNLVALMNEKPRWISVEDKESLPDTDSGVVGYFGGGAFNQLRWYDFVTTLSDGTIACESTERDVTNEHCIAVYKLPEPPKEAQDGT